MCSYILTQSICNIFSQLLDINRHFMCICKPICFYSRLTILRQVLIVFTARKRSWRRLCFYTCLSVILFTGVTCVVGGVCGREGMHGRGWACMAGGMHCKGMHGGGMHVRGACMVGGMCGGGHTWGVCMAGGVRGRGVLDRGHAWGGRAACVPRTPPDTTKYGWLLFSVCLNEQFFTV